MAWTDADIDALKAAIVSRQFARAITFSDQSVTFESIEDMLKLLAVMEAQVSTRSTRTRFAATSKGI